LSRAMRLMRAMPTVTKSMRAAQARDTATVSMGPTAAFFLAEPFTREQERHRREHAIKRVIGWSSPRCHGGFMKITDVRAAVVGGNFSWVLVKVYTDEGITGVGEAYWGVGVKEMIHAIKGYVIGEDPMDVDRLYQRMYRGLIAVGSMAGTITTAISGVEIALWDIAGKRAGLPVYRLLGGRFRDRVRIYCDSHGGVEGKEFTPEGFGERARQVRAKGFTALKFDVDQLQRGGDGYNRCLGNADIDLMASCVQAVRGEVGPHVDFAVDCHWRYNVSDALRLAYALEPYRLMWLEDPLPPENVDAMAKLTAKSRIPICTGENLYTRHGFRELVEKQAVDILAPDIPKVGGLLEARRIAEMADTYYMAFAPHNVSSPVGTIASAHVCASVPNFLVLEYHAIDVPWWDSLVKGGPVIKNGFIEMTEKPGLGVELNEEELAKHLREGETLP